MTDQRWPRWVYGSGDEPDYRFTYANERTFLAWIRTALALLACGVAVDSIGLSLGGRWRPWVAAILVVLGALCAMSSWIRWARAERAMRHNAALPSSGTSAVLGATVAVLAVVLLVALA